MENESITILVVDDDPDIIEFVGYNLKKEGYSVINADNGVKAITMCKKYFPNLILLDVMMPEMDGIETCEKIRSIPYMDKSIIAFLTARGEEYSQIAGFEAGADDYITKPIRPKLLVSRIKALLKRVYTFGSAPVVNNEPLKKGELLIDKEKYVISLKDNTLVLPKKEFELLLLLSSKPGKVFTRDEIFESVWGEKIIVGDRTIDVHIRKLREKIGSKFIHTIKGVGYKFIEH